MALLFSPGLSWAQAVEDETQSCNEAAERLVSELRPHASTPQIYPSDTYDPKGDGKKVATLPRGYRPVRPMAQMRFEQRANRADRMAEACYRMAVEIGRHHGLALDGQESYQRLQELMEQEQRDAREQARALSRPASCSIPGTSETVSESASKCIVLDDPALCPGCLSGYRHTCTRVQGTNDAKWIRSSKCMASELRSARTAAESGFDRMYTSQMTAAVAGSEEEQRREEQAAALNSNPRSSTYTTHSPIPARAAKPARPVSSPRPHHCVSSPGGASCATR